MRAPGTLALALAAALPASAGETVVSARLLGGQHLADGRSRAFSGAASGAAAAALALGESWTLFPSVSGSWRGVESALDAPGGGTLFQESMDHRVSFKAVRQGERSHWRLKPAASWRARLVRETKDEPWLEGLFDRHTLDAGLEAEYLFGEGVSASVGYDFARTLFPNYATLESSAGTDPRGRPLGRELAGASALDADAHILSAGVAGPLGRGVSGEGRVALQRQDWLDQKLVRADGSLVSDTRTDMVSTFEGALRAAREPRPDLRVSGGLTVGVEGAVSNQAAFDPARARYEPRHYDYLEWSAGPQAALSAGDPRAPASLSVSTRYAQRRWPHRSARDAAGAYAAEGLIQRVWSLALEGRWPLGPGLAMLARLEHERGRANDHYEAFYRFNHDATAFLLGLEFGP